jgi:sulfite reductase (ferredoxin)
MDSEKKVSPVEKIKAASGYLRGRIDAELADGNDFFGKESVQLLKHHGVYQQHDRDDRISRARAAGVKSGRAKAYSYMVRTKIPGGRLSPEQLLAEFDLCDEVGNSTLRITTRQGLQLHGVLKRDLKRVIGRINEVQLSTLAACGDVERNVMCCPAPHNGDPVHAEMQTLADSLAEHLCPRTTAYHELWLTEPDTGGRILVGGGADGHQVEPIYGTNYLPRKFKTAIGLPGDNCVDLYTNDLAFMAICEDYKIVGYNVLAGGGMGVTPSAKKTFPALARRIGFVTPDRVVELATAIVKIHRDFGNRADRKVARLKYLIADWGVARFKGQVEEYFGDRLAAPHPDDVFGFDDHIGWHEQGDGRWYYGLNIENGRLCDTPKTRLKSALREVLTGFRPGIRLTAHQSMLLTDVADGDRTAIERALRGYSVTLSDQISNARRWSMACPALPTCGLAVAESERALPGMIDALEVELAKLGLSRERFTLRMTGCPNGCARPYNADIGVVGKTAGKYTILLGGRTLGDRLNFIYKDLVPRDEIVPTLIPVLTFFKQSRYGEETLGDFCARQGAEKLLAWAER